MTPIMQIVYSSLSNSLSPRQMRQVIKLGKSCYDYVNKLRCTASVLLQKASKDPIAVKAKWTYEPEEVTHAVINKVQLSPAGSYLNPQLIISNPLISRNLQEALVKTTKPDCQEVALYELKNVRAATKDPFVFHPEDGILAFLSYGVGRRMTVENRYNHLYFESIHKSRVGPDEKRSGLTLDLRTVSGDVFCHWLVEALPRLDYFRQHYGSLAQADHIIASGKDLAYKKETLTLAGVDLRQVIWLGPDEYIECDHLVTFTPMEIKAGSSRVSKSLGSLLNNHSRISSQSQWSGKKVFISRQRARFRKLENFLATEKLLQQAGYEIVLFECLSFVEQLDCVMNAAVILGVHGSAYSFIHLLPDDHDIMIAEIFPATYINPLFCNWSLNKKLRYSAFIGKGDIDINAHDIGANIQLDLPSFSQWLHLIST